MKQGLQHYYERRAEEERAASERATDARAAQSHRSLSDEYRKRASQGVQPLVDEPGERGTLSKDFRIVP